MKPKFTIDNVEYEFKEIGLKTFLELQKLVLEESKTNQFKIVELLTNCPVDILRRCVYSDWLMVWDEAQLQILDLSKESDGIKPVIEFKGTRYALPNIDEMSVGEFADLDLILTNPNDDKKALKICSILYRPILKQVKTKITLEEYSIEGFNRRMDEFEEFPISAVKSAQSFFLQYANKSLKSMTESLVDSQVMKMLPKEDQEILQKVLQEGFGGESSTYWQERILSSLMKLRDFQSDQLSIGWLGGLTKTKKKSIKERIKEFVDKKKLKKVK